MKVTLVLRNFGNFLQVPIAGAGVGCPADIVPLARLRDRLNSAYGIEREADGTDINILFVLVDEHGEQIDF